MTAHRRRTEGSIVLEPIVYVDHSDIRAGKLEELEVAMTELVAFVDAHEPQLISYGFFVDEQANTVTLVAVHPDTASMELHMKVAGPGFRKFQELLELRRIDVYGRPSAQVVAQLHEKVQLLGTGGEVVLHDLHAGFTRVAAAASRAT